MMVAARYGCAALLAFGSVPAAAPEAAAAERSRWLDNTRAAVDVAARVLHEGRSGNTDGVQFFGIDSHKVFTGRRGDIGTLLVQLYATRLVDMESHGAPFDDEDDSALVFRNVNFNYTGLGDGRLNFRVGHFEVPFGLEQVVNTNGTLRQYLHARSIGVKGDWGASVNGELDWLEYEIAWTRGSGNSWESAGDPGLVAARFGTLRDRNRGFGLSVLDGEVYQPASPDTPLERWRVGLDGHWYWRRLELMGEVSGGEDAGVDVLNLLLETSLHARDGAWLAYSQVRRFETGAETEVSLTVGAELDLGRHWTFSGEFVHRLETFADAPRSNLLKAQIRYRFN